MLWVTKSNHIKAKQIWEHFAQQIVGWSTNKSIWWILMYLCSSVHFLSDNDTLWRNCFLGCQRLLQPSNPGPYLMNSICASPMRHGTDARLRDLIPPKMIQRLPEACQSQPLSSIHGPYLMLIICLFPIRRGTEVTLERQDCSQGCQSLLHILLGNHL